MAVLNVVCPNCGEKIVVDTQNPVCLSCRTPIDIDEAVERYTAVINREKAEINRQKKETRKRKISEALERLLLLSPTIITVILSVFSVIGGKDAPLIFMGFALFALPFAVLGFKSMDSDSFRTKLILGIDLAIAAVWIFLLLL